MLRGGNLNFAKQVGRCSSAAKPVSHHDAYEVEKDLLHSATKKQSGSRISYKEFRSLSNQEKRKILLRDPGCHYERNVKKYNYIGAAA